jgi:hypothetical protein
LNPGAFTGGLEGSGEGASKACKEREKSWDILAPLENHLWQSTLFAADGKPALGVVAF